ncbi:Ni/Fe-hydrogenase, b-type cytochrome subunit [uncultured Meiothermus sp.]|jgi:Ni/Fe-hydrogenase 1 B-type cytochrome subunit|uniref:Ni/Fe-hydrogenase, b-type cytochrome subunit n=1 Tax=uncultured Meiothermus sp. TaxID=157471 RepID=UPI0026129D47|nr:Ni/Fe-hydrogenase, b-type cytochrome subunit [uncultured Meiothermus sp.]
MANPNPQEPVRLHYTFGRFTRASHWIRVVLIVWLSVSGFYIANPFLTPDLRFDQLYIRSLHIAAGWFLLAITLIRIYEFFFLKPGPKLGLGQEVSMGRILFDWKAWRDQLAFYTLLRRDHPTYIYSNYGPLQYLAYIVLYLSLVVVILTGLILAAPYQSMGLAGWTGQLLKPLEVALGGLANVRIYHHIAMWVLIVFTLIHVYMVAWYSIRGRSMVMEAMISGYKVDDAQPQK